MLFTALLLLAVVDVGEGPLLMPLSTDSPRGMSSSPVLLVPPPPVVPIHADGSGFNSSSWCPPSAPPSIQRMPVSLSKASSLSLSCRAAASEAADAVAAWACSAVTIAALMSSLCCWLLADSGACL
jgi:hypothetical protein